MSVGDRWVGGKVLRGRQLPSLLHPSLSCRRASFSTSCYPTPPSQIPIQCVFSYLSLAVLFHLTLAFELRGIHCLTRCSNSE
ncbi:hypothetical protein CEXT_331091 [Caerostris extrusa]|uniref:Uncharacterized protein n=1 Tax=Caerostris extrusa TaxID=172846 RepID=A0AAV4V8M6_CAEEX|nr:hypothetical protein CEXT_331091 [Caerostris extrusa]